MRRIGNHTLAVAILLFASAAESGDLTFDFDDWAGPALPVRMFVPDSVAAETTIVVVMHGASRDAPRYYLDWRAAAEEHDFVVVVPLFSADAFRGSARYNLGYVFDPETGAQRPAESWTFAAIEPLFDDVVKRLGGAQTQYTMFGHSAGSQFVHRFLYYVPDARVSRAILANAGWYTMPDFGVEYPYGLGDAGVSADVLPGYFARDVVVLLGDADVDSNHEDLRKTPEAELQGRHRFDRGHSFVRVAKARAKILDTAFNWRLQVVTGAEHSNADMTPAAASLVDPAPPVTVIENGTVYSGANSDPVQTDVWIQGDRILAVGSADGLVADTSIDASGLAIAPGFIDLHSHAVRENNERSGLYRWPDAENLLRQGVTTVIGGPDGWSPLPLEDSFTRFAEQGAAVNYGSFVGHGAVRESVVGLDDRPATEEELERMREVVDVAMRQGAFGLSSGLVYIPGSFADTDEIITLAEVAGQHGGIYISHMRNEALEVLDSAQELIRIAEAAGLPAQITHAKAMGTAMQGRSKDLLALVDDAVARGVDISIDQYPYAAGSTGLTVQFPRWSRDGGDRELARRLADPELRAQIHATLVYELTEVRGRNDPANVQLAYCNFDHSLDGLNLAELLTQKGREVTVENAATLIIELQEAGGCQAIYHAMHEEDVVTILQHPRTMIAADGGIEVPGNGHPHPRNYGTFARVLGRYVRELEVLPMHTAVHKMTRLPADRIGLASRGRIEAGAIADIVVFDPGLIIDRATFGEPHQYAEGMQHVFVAGEAVLLDGHPTGARPGRVLRSSAYKKNN